MPSVQKSYIILIKIALQMFIAILSEHDGKYFDVHLFEKCYWVVDWRGKFSLLYS